MAAALLVLACLVLGVTSTHAASSRKADRQVGGAAPLYWGAWIGDQLTGTAPPWEMAAAERFEQIVGKKMSLIEFSSPFKECAGGKCHSFEFPTPQMTAIRRHGSIPVFSWGSEIASPEGVSQSPIGLSKIISGRYDGYIHRFAAAAAAWGHPFFLRFDWEMNGRWFPWSAGANGNKPGEYVAAWRHVHDIFTAAGATNATWVWCPYVDPKHNYPDIRSFYPGSSYVDWTCMDGYNWGSNSVNPQKWKSFEQLFHNTYQELTRTVAPGKPVMLGELASNSSGGSKAAWIRQMFARLARAYPEIRALIWFDTVDRGVDWPIETSSAATKAFRAGIAGSRYLPANFAAIKQLPIAAPR